MMLSAPATRILVCLFIYMCGPTAVGIEQSVSAASSAPHWIWHSEAEQSISRPNDGRTYVFARAIEIKESIQAANLRFAADFCHATVLINGVAIVRVDAMSPTADVDVLPALRLGRNVLQIKTQAVLGPSAIALSLRMRGLAEEIKVVTDTAWSVECEGDVALSREPRSSYSHGTVLPELWGIDRRGKDLDAGENYEQWQLAGIGSTLSESQFSLPPGFKVSLVRAALPEEDSWISLAFDPKGRLVVAQEEKGLLRMTLDSSRAAVVTVEQLNDELQECRGIVFAGNSCYVNANNSKGMYQLSDMNGNDRLNQVDLLREFSGSVGHGRNDLAVAADGWIYSIHGDSVDVPTEDLIDRTSPFSDASNAGNNRQGHVVRTNPQGSQWELFCAGLRNPYGIAAGPDGEWFTYDADAEFDMGAPWYRGTRIVHLVSGADYGWRGVTGQWPPYYPDHPDNAPPLLEIGKGSPTAAVFGTETRFPSEYQRALFVLDWTYGRVLAIHLAPRGAGYRAAAETFLQGRPLNVTDIAISEDGAMFLLTGGRKTQSAIYRVEYMAEDSTISESSPHEKAALDQAVVARALRHQLELGHSATTHSLELAWHHLDSHDDLLRYAARIAIEHQPVATWRLRALEESRSIATVEAMLALVRSSDAQSVEAVIERLLALPTEKMRLGETWGVLHCYSLLRATAREAIDLRRAAIVKQIETIMSGLPADVLYVCRAGNSGQVRRDAALLLAQLEAESAVEITVRELFSSPSQVDQLQGLFALRNARIGWSAAARRSYFQLLGESRQFVGGEGLPGFLAKISAEAESQLDAKQLDELADVIAPPTVDVEPLPLPRPLVKQWTMEELVPSLNDSSPDYKADRMRGEVIFRDAQCSRCHRSGARGPAVGPDLTHVGQRFSRHDVLQSILLPSAAVAENYRGVQIVTVDGRLISGRLVEAGDYRSQVLRIATDPLQPTEMVAVDKREIDSMRESPVSPMPAGLLDTFQLDEILDLLEYLTAGK